MNAHLRLSRTVSSGLRATAIVAASCALVACGAVDEPTHSPMVTASALVYVGGASSCKQLFAGQHHHAGWVCTTIDNTVDTSADCGPGKTGVASVTYLTEDGWLLKETHMAAGLTLADIPTNKAGNPQPGQFRYKASVLEGSTSWSADVPLCRFGLDASMTTCDPVTATLAAHAVVYRTNGGVLQTETAWADGQRFARRGSWAEYFNLVLECKADNPLPPEQKDCETAWAYTSDALAFCNNDMNGDGRNETRWGWYGEIAPGSYQYDLYAGAGRCDISKGKLVGKVGVTYDGTSASFSITTATGFAMEETHVYADSSRQDTLAPGQLTDLHERLDGASSDSYAIEVTGDPIYFSVHAVVCGDFDVEGPRTETFGPISLAFEDQKVEESDWDYNDWVVAIDTHGTFVGDNLTHLKFDITPLARGAVNQHDFNLVLPVGTFASGGHYTLEILDPSGAVLSTATGTLNASVDTDIRIWDSTLDALPKMSNTGDPYGGTVSEPLQTARLSIAFAEGPNPFNFGDAGAMGIHGQDLFFQPYLYNYSWNQNHAVAAGDIRMLAIPGDWRWPTERTRIWDAYDVVSMSDGRPVFAPSWWVSGFNAALVY